MAKGSIHDQPPSAARLIVNADDFGLTRGINRAIGELRAAGVLTSATLIANGPGFEDAVEIARAHPNLGVGCHIVLTDGIPVSAPESIRTLLGPDRRTFRPRLRGFLQALFTGSIRSEDIAREAFSQIEKIQRAGIRITHLDTHKHTHLFPSVSRPLLEVAERTGIRAIRSPFEPAWGHSSGQGSTSRRMAVRALTLLKPAFDSAPQLHSGAVRTTDGTVAISATGSLDAAMLRDLLGQLPATGTYELCCHPGYNDADLDLIATRLRAHRDTEREALLSEIPRLLARPGAPVLISYTDLVSYTDVWPTA
jgi:chitin disaccharide deacetylase